MNTEIKTKKHKFGYFCLIVAIIIVLGFNIWWAAEEWDFGDDDDDHHHNRHHIETTTPPEPLSPPKILNFDVEVIHPDSHSTEDMREEEPEDIQVIVEEITAKYEDDFDYATETVSEGVPENPIFYPAGVKILNDEERVNVERILNPMPESFDEFVNRPKVLDDSVDHFSLFPTKDIFENKTSSGTVPETDEYDSDADYEPMGDDPWDSPSSFLSKIFQGIRSFSFDDDGSDETEGEDDDVMESDPMLPSTTEDVMSLMSQVDQEIQEITFLRNRSDALLEKIGKMVADQGPSADASISAQDVITETLLESNVEETADEVEEDSVRSEEDNEKDEPHAFSVAELSDPNFPFLPFFSPSNVAQISQNEDGTLRSESLPTYQYEPRIQDNKRLILLRPPKVVGPPSNLGSDYGMNGEDVMSQDPSSPLSLGAFMRMIHDTSDDEKLDQPPLRPKKPYSVLDLLHRPIASDSEDVPLPSDRELYQSSSDGNMRQYIRLNPFRLPAIQRVAPVFNPFGQEFPENLNEETLVPLPEAQPDPHHVQKRVLENHEVSPLFQQIFPREK